MKDTLTTTEAAKLLGFHVNTLKNWVRESKMPAFKTLGGHYRIRVVDLVRVLRENSIPVPTQLQSRYTIIVIDEDATFQAQIRGLFSGKPDTFDIKPFLSGYDALVEIGKKPPELILLSLGLTQMDGLQLISKLKSNPDTENLKVIAVSDRPEQANSAASAGATDFFDKSSGPSALIELIKKTANDRYLDFPTMPGA
jgi:excisionase family DNA binding protein